MGDALLLDLRMAAAASEATLSVPSGVVTARIGPRERAAIEQVLLGLAPAGTTILSSLLVQIAHVVVETGAGVVDLSATTPAERAQLLDVVTLHDGDNIAVLECACHLVGANQVGAALLLHALADAVRAAS